MMAPATAVAHFCTCLERPAIETAEVAENKAEVVELARGNAPGHPFSDRPHQGGPQNILRS
eukprot:45042-Alexandrium_andersonii.AAC.1